MDTQRLYLKVCDVDCNLDFPQIVIEKGATLVGLMQR